ncbi:hypothetical protein [Actinoallomurus bryophytorum]|nr:hypothetical protein [Actinoallomurus bryophytorum]
MTSGVTAIPPWQAMTEEQVDRWEEVLSTLAGMVPSDAARVVVDGERAHATVADRLAVRLEAAGRPCTRVACDAPVPEMPGTLTLADGHPAAGAWDVTIWLRTSQPASQDAEHDADIVLDLHDGTWPMIRHVALRLAGAGDWYVAESRAFFAAPERPRAPDPAPPREP